MSVSPSDCEKEDLPVRIVVNWELRSEKAGLRRSPLILLPVWAVDPDPDLYGSIFI